MGLDLLKDKPSNMEYLLIYQFSTFSTLSAQNVALIKSPAHKKSRKCLVKIATFCARDF